MPSEKPARVKKWSNDFIMSQDLEWQCPHQSQEVYWTGHEWPDCRPLGMFEKTPCLHLACLGMFSCLLIPSPHFGRPPHQAYDWLKRLPCRPCAWVWLERLPYWLCAWAWQKPSFSQLELHSMAPSTKIIPGEVYVHTVLILLRRIENSLTIVKLQGLLINTHIQPIHMLYLHTWLKEYGPLTITPIQYVSLSKIVATKLKAHNCVKCLCMLEQYDLLSLELKDLAQTCSSMTSLLCTKQGL